VNQQSIGEIVLRFRLIIGITLVAASIFMMAGIFRVHFTTKFTDFFPLSHRNVQLNQEFGQYGGAQTIILMLRKKHGDIFNPETIQKLYALTQAVDILPAVNHNEVFSLTSERLSFAEAVEGGVLRRPFIRPGFVPRTEQEINDLRTAVEFHRSLVRALVSDDNSSAAVIASFSDAVNYPELFKQLQGLVSRYQDSNDNIYLAGEPITRAYGYVFLPRVTVIFLSAIGLMIGVLYLNLGYRTRWWIPVITGSLSAIWGLGFVGWAGFSFDPVMLVIPFILSARDFSHGIQWQGRYYDEFDRLRAKHDACITTTNAMLPPGLLSITADIAGIIFISFGGIPVLQHVAFAGSVWLASSVAMVFVFQPILMSYLPPPSIKRAIPPGTQVEQGFVGRWLARGGNAIVAVAVTRGPARLGLICLSAGVIGWGILSGARAQIGYLTPGTPLYLPTAKVNQDIAEIAKHFPLDQAWVIITTPKFPDEHSVLGPPVLRMVSSLRAFLASEPHVKQVSSFATDVERPFNQMLHYEYPKYFGVPSDVQLSGNIWGMFLGGSAPGELEYYISDQDSKDTCVRILLSDHTYDTLASLTRRLQSFVDQHAKELNKWGVQVRFLGGGAGLYGAANDVLYQLDLVNITFVLAVIFVFCLFTFNSFVAASLFLLCCVLANFAAFIYMSLRGIGLTIDTIPVISLGIGLGIDYGIYTVSRIRDEVVAGRELNEAIGIALRSTGVAVFTTFLVMVGGILPWAFSPVAFHNGMSILLMFLMGTNMIAGVVVLPAVISWTRPRFICRIERQASEGRKASELEMRVAGET
jgi:uncharacterized protein